MGRVIETMSTVNSFARTLIALVVTGALCVGGWFGYSFYNENELALERKDAELIEARQELDARLTELKEKDATISMQGATIAEQVEEISALEIDVREKAKRIEHLNTAMRLLKTDHRLARINVLDQSEDPETGKLQTKVEFVEVNDEGAPIDKPRVFTLEGDMIYVDYWVVKFDDEYVEGEDLLRGTSITLFRRIFGEFQEPNEGYQLDIPGARPGAYARGGQPTEFEKKIWDDFWTFANDKEKAAELGIRAAHGEAANMKLRKGKSYRLLLRASAGLSITPEDAPPTLPRSPVPPTSGT